MTTTQDESQWANGFIAAQSPEADTLSYAAVSSNGIKEAVRSALAQVRS